MTKFVKVSLKNLWQANVKGYYMPYKALFHKMYIYTHNTLYTSGVCVSSRTQKATSMKRVKPPPEARQSVVGVYRNPMFSAGSQEQLNAP